MRPPALVALLVGAISTTALVPQDLRAQDESSSTVRAIEVTDLLASGRAERASTNFVRRIRSSDLDRESTRRVHFLPDEYSFVPDALLLEDDQPPLIGRRPLDPAQLEILLDSMTDGQALIEFERVGGRTFLRTTDADLVTRSLDTLRSVGSGRLRVELKLTAESDSAQGTPIRTLVEADAGLEDGRVRAFGLRRQTARLSRLEPEVAMGSSIGDPISELFDQGATVALRARSLPFSDRILVECLIRCASVEDPEEMQIHETLGPLERVTRRFDEVGLTFVVRPGEEASAAWMNRDLRQSRLSLTITPETERPARNSVPIAWTNLTNTPIVGFGYEIDPYVETEPTSLVEFLERAAFESDEVVAMFDSSANGDAGVFALRNNPEGQAKATEIGARLATLFPAGQVRVRLIEVDGDLPESFATTTGEESEVRRGVTFRAPILPEMPTSLVIGVDLSLIVEQDTEIAQGARMLAPVVELVEEGSFLTLTPRVGPSGSIEAVTVALDASNVRHRTVDTTLSSRMLGNTQSTIPFVLERDTVPVELPETDHLSFRETISLNEVGFGLTTLTVPMLQDRTRSQQFALLIQVDDR